MRENYTTLTNGEILTVRGSKTEEFRFLIDKFEPEGDGICVVDTDLEVDIEALNKLGKRSSRSWQKHKKLREPLKAVPSEATLMFGSLWWAKLWQGIMWTINFPRGIGRKPSILS